MITSVKVKAAFIDRDGVLNEERNYVHNISDFVLLPEVIEGLALLRDARYLLIVVTNQAGIARGYYDQTEIDHLHVHLRELLAAQGVTLDAIYFCPHHPQGSIAALAIEGNCRKPSPGHLLKASNDFNLNLATSLLIGDKFSDLQAGKRAGVGLTAIVESGHKSEQVARIESDVVAANLLASVRILTSKEF